MKWTRKKKYAEQDYTESMLPKNRKEVFFDVIKLNWKSFLSQGLVILLFSIPLIIVSVLQQLIYLETSSLEITEQEMLYLLSGQANTFALIKIPCIVILFVGLAGIIRMVRQYAWEENVLFSVDFTKGIKSNVGFVILVGLIVGITNWMSVWCSNQVGFATNTIQSILLYLPVLFFALLLLPLSFYFVVCVSIYNVKFGTLLKMSFISFAKKPFKTYLAVLCCLPFFVLLLIPNTICIFLGYLITPLLLPFVLLGAYLFALNVLDDVINKQYYPELVDRGLFKEELPQ